MKTFFTHLKAASFLFVLLASTACVKGPKGDPGAPGDNGKNAVDQINKVEMTINCSGRILNQPYPYDILNGLYVSYTAVIMSSQDVYATGAVWDPSFQVSSTSFYSASQAGAQAASVNMIYDFVGNDNHGSWTVSLNRQNMVTTVVYNDQDYASPLSLNFNPGACEIED